MTTILFVDHASALGGAEHSLLLILKHLDREHWIPHLACSLGHLEKEATALKIPVHPIDFPRLRRSPRFLLDWLKGVREIVRLARGVGAQALYANTVRAAVYTALAAWLAGVPFIWHMRDFWLSESRPQALWADSLGKRLLMMCAKQVITNSHAVAQHLPTSPKISVVHNAIETDAFHAESSGDTFRVQYQIPVEAPVVGMVGRLRPWKGQDRFLRAMLQVAKRMPEARYVIVGGEIFGVQDACEEELRQLVVSLGLAESVIFTGQLSDVRPALAAMDVFVHPGDPEPFGLVNIEAMAMGKPIVAFGHGALPEIIVDGKTGLLVTPREEAALAKAVITLMHDPARRARMGQAARERVEHHFSMPGLISNVEGILREVVG